ncbi:hypothetical protein F4821DRAFT_279480 [Hypoxylon rubiginosum]|uniref:Uncharacterized protein n=1 Tax=Hypoxylon rubiginosum TaxID=110542 RepID=A0ACC0DH12_9PEZI|nr:hypothetical protein F4821DRAFT_279480 [Hypoxylon rubiginosum]
MALLRGLFITGWLGCACLAYPSGNSSVSVGNSSDLTGNSFALTSNTCWDDHMRDVGYPPNPEVCKMITNNDTNTWNKSMASDFMWSYLNDNGGLIDDWVQQLHKNATAESGKTPGDLDCSVLYSENCQPPSDGDCENYNPAAFQIIQTEVVNLYSILQSMDIMSIKETLIDGLKIGELVRDFIPESDLAETKKEISIAAAVMWVVAGILSFAPGFAGAAGGLMEGSLAVLGTLNKLDVTSYFGAFAFNTFGAILAISSTSITDDAIDIGKMEDALSSHLGDFFQSISDKTVAITAKVFGGHPSQDIDLTDFVATIDSKYNTSRGSGDANAETDDARFENGWFLEPAGTETLIQPLFEAGFELMRAGLIGYLFSARKFYVMHFTDIDEDSCLGDYEGAGRFMGDEGCYVLKIGGKCINHDDNAWGELRRIESKYNMISENMFRNVRDCNNNGALMEKNVYSVDRLGELSQCFFPLNYLHNPTPRDIWNINQTIADQLGLGYQHYPYEETMCPLPY